ncbi:hypothetical protein [Paenirhodobacter sp.]
MIVTSSEPEELWCGSRIGSPCLPMLSLIRGVTLRINPTEVYGLGDT